MEYLKVISHSGVRGQKWGRRRYQNSDGSLTPLGRSHYGVGPPRGSNKTESVSISEDKKPSRNDASKMSDQQLRDITNRLNLENNYINAIDRNSALYQTGKSKTDIAIEKLEKINRAGNAVKGIVISTSTINKILNSNKKK